MDEEAKAGCRPGDARWYSAKLGALAGGEDAAPNIMQMRENFQADWAQMESHVASDSCLPRRQLSTMTNQHTPGPHQSSFTTKTSLAESIYGTKKVKNIYQH